MYGPCLSPIVAGRPLRPATRHSLGGLLPRQQADRTQAPPKPTYVFTLSKEEKSILSDAMKSVRGGKYEGLIDPYTAGAIDTPQTDGQNGKMPFCVP